MVGVKTQTLISSTGINNEYVEQIRPAYGDAPHLVMVAHGSGSDGSSYVVERAPNAGKPSGDLLPKACRVATADGFCFTAPALGGGAVDGSYDPAEAADKFAAAVEVCRGRVGPWGGCRYEKIVALGVSMGFITVTATLIRHPGLIRGVVGLIPALSASYIWEDLFHVSVPPEVVPYDAETHPEAFSGIPTVILSMRNDQVVDDANESHHSAFAETIGAPRWRFGFGTHGMSQITPAILRSALAQVAL